MCYRLVGRCATSSWNILWALDFDHSRDKPGETELNLLATILNDLPQILDKVRTEFENYETDPSSIEHLKHPHIWIASDEDDEDSEDEHPEEWTFVIERGDWADYGYHVEFHGGEFQGIWSGD